MKWKRNDRANVSSTTTNDSIRNIPRDQQVSLSTLQQLQRGQFVNASPQQVGTNTHGGSHHTTAVPTDERRRVEPKQVKA